MEFAYSTPRELQELERQKSAYVGAMEDAETKKARRAVEDDPSISPQHVWCPLRHQWIDTPICARMQSQKRVIRKCKKCRCRWMDSWWSEKLMEARRQDDPKDHSLGYLRTEQYTVTRPKKKKGRKSKIKT